VIRENDRVLRGVAAIDAGDIEELGRLMLESHASSRDLLGNSTPALDVLVETASRLPGFVGGKLTGGGFGGSTVNLVETDRLESFGAEIERAFRESFGRAPALVRSRIGDGSRVLRSSRGR
jgi:galactokinase